MEEITKTDLISCSLLISENGIRWSGSKRFNPKFSHKSNIVVYEIIKEE
jgi:hypothetical protein